MKINRILAELCSAAGVSGAENGACEAAAGMLKRYTDDVNIDCFGCVTGYVGRRGSGKPVLLLEAHIDEIGFIVTYIDEKGFLRVGQCGGTDRRLYAAQRVTIHTDNGAVRGIICTLPPHVASDSKKAMKLEEVAIDIGCTSREEAEKLTAPGDRVTIENGLTELMGTRVTAKAIDDRSGVAAVLYALELLRGAELPYDIEVLFASQEEVGSRGAVIAAYRSSAEKAIATDVSFAYTPDAKKHECGEMGKGAMIGISPVLDREMTAELRALAIKLGIPWQSEVMGGSTGTDADDISVSRGGIRTALVSIPLKYMHTPVEVVDTADIEAVAKLMAAYAAGGTLPEYEEEPEQEAEIPAPETPAEYTGIYANIAMLSKLCGPSGGEEDVRGFIKSRLPADCETKTDGIGNLIVFRKGAAVPKNKLMFCAHMDEVGFIITDYTEDGRLKFAPLGGISPAVVFGRRVIFADGTVGVIAAKATHQLKDEEKEDQPKIASLAIDIGASNRNEAMSRVSQGDLCCFMGGYEEFGNGFAAGKALDDRAGCAILLELINSDLPYDCTFVFTVQEEVGTRGAACAAYNVRPDIAVILETTTACDIAGSEDEKRVCELGKGVVVSFMDRSTIYDRELYKAARSAADEAGIKNQTKTLIAGGNDSGAVHKAVGGIRTAALSVPTRYLHSPACVMKKEDIDSTLAAARLVMTKFAGI
jgi:endoglucanase